MQDVLQPRLIERLWRSRFRRDPLKVAADPMSIGVPSRRWLNIETFRSLGGLMSLENYG
jgi:hypothetical protein